MSIGRLVAGRYEVLERLGVGSFFVVFKGRDRASGRQVALKAVQPELMADQGFVDALREGAGEVVDLAHANVARVYEVIVEGDALYVVTEFVRGIDLKERIKRIAPFTISVAVDFAVGICEALQYAHASRVVHGDLRPHNVIISPEGVVKVTDFGLARAVSGSQLASMRNLAHTAPYQAPEVALQSAVLPGTDLYALGAVLFEMLTGGLPYPGDTPLNVAMKHQNEPVPSPRALNPGVPRALEGVVMKSMQKRLDDRYRAASDMLTDLRAVRDALRFGRSLSWTPLAPAPAAPSPVEPAAREPSPSAAPAPEPPRAEPARTGGTPMPPRRDYDEDRVSPWLRLAIGSVIVILILTCVIGAALWLATFSRPTNKTFPNLVGLQIDDARKEADKSSVKLILREEYNDRYDPGVVYRSDYEAGRPIRPGRTVLVWVSRGSRLVWVPDLVNLSADQAEAKLKESGLSLGQVNRSYDNRVPYGCVISQNPRSGKRVDRETPVALVLSDGPEDGETVAGDTPPDGAGSESDDVEHVWNITHTVRRDGRGSRQVRIEYEDSLGASTAFDEVRSEGDVVKVRVTARGASLIVRTYYDDDPTPINERTETWRGRR